MKTIYATLFSSLLLFPSCYSNNEEKIKELESKLEQQEDLINLEKEQRLRDELEQKEKEIEALKNKNSSQSNSNSSFFARGMGMFPEGSERRLTKDDLISLGSRELKIMRNEIFARHGYIFKTSDMINHFSGESWYKPIYNDVTAMLSTIEKANVNFIKSYE